MEENKKKFYQECLKNKYFNLEDEYENQKINLIAKKYRIIDSSNENDSISRELFESIKSEYEAWKQESDIQAAQAKLEKQRESEKISAGWIDLAYKKFEDIREKRRSELMDRLNVLEIYEKTSDQEWQASMYHQSGGGEAKSNPYAVGGFAEGLGGIGAGLASFADAVADNARIDANNKTASEIAAAAWLNGARDKVYSKRAEYRFYKDQYDKVDIVYVSNDHELAKHLIAKIDYSISATGCLTLDLIVAVDPRFKPDISRNIDLSIDGNFALLVMNEDKDDILVDSIVQLPAFGVLLNKDEEGCYYVKLKKIIPDAGLPNNAKIHFAIMDSALSLIETDSDAFARVSNRIKVKRNTLKSYYCANAKELKDYYDCKKTILNSENAEEIEAAVSTLTASNNGKDRAYLIDKGNERIGELGKKKKKKKTLIFSAIAAAVVLISFAIVLKVAIIPNSRYNNAVKLMDNGKYEEAINAFAALSGYKDSESQIEICKTSIKEIKYNDALGLMSEGKYAEAKELYNEIIDYKDSKEKYTEASFYNDIKIISVSKVEDVVEFGSYEQDNNTENGKEKIEWIVLDRSGSSVLLISKYCLDCKPYNTSFTQVTWETCTLRKWLNDTFMRTAFSEKEQQRILLTHNNNPDTTKENDPDYYYGVSVAEGGNDTDDHVFLLSLDEASKYSNQIYFLSTPSTAYAESKGARNRDANHMHATVWWLRSPGRGSSMKKYDTDIAITSYAFDVGDSGYMNDNRVDADSFGVRPAIWVNTK